MKKNEAPGDQFQWIHIPRSVSQSDDPSGLVQVQELSGQVTTYKSQIQETTNYVSVCAINRYNPIHIFFGDLKGGGEQESLGELSALMSRSVYFQTLENSHLKLSKLIFAW